MSKASTEEKMSQSPLPTPITPDEEEMELASLAINLGRERLLNKTATAQEILYFAKLGSSTVQAENEKLRKEVELLTAKTEALQSQKTSEELFAKAIDAMRLYRGESDDEDIQ